jgi:membrane-bound lytic murein transglycosylase D
VTFPANAALTAKVTAELKTTQSDFPLVVNDYVAGFISYFSNSPAGHAHLLRSLERAGKYKEMISKNLRDQGVPQDLIYLAVAESGFQPQALNARSGAGGMWQFMPTGAYGLARNGWFDERFDPQKSSIAYAKYMKTLYNQFGDWYLAMAAYDWGPGNVQRAVMKTGYADFWELYRRGNLPAETKNYVPGIIAAIIMAKNPEQYGLDKVVPDAPVISDTVTVDYAIDLRLVADVTNSSLLEVVALNPSLLRMTTPRDMSFDLHIPLGTRDVFEERIKDIPEDKRNSWRFHVVKSGETLDGIATALHAHANDIAATNELAKGDGVDAGDELVIPVASALSLSPQRYALRRGDTLITVADRFGVSVEDLRRWNHLSSNHVQPGSSIAVAEPVKLAPVTRVRSRSARGKSSSHTATSSVHAASTHTEIKHASSKISGPPTSSKKTSTPKKQKSTLKSK